MAGQKTNNVILFVEDEVEYRDILSKALTQEGFDVNIAKDGQEAIKMVVDDELTPDLIILDLLMPNVTGWSFMNKLKELNKDFIPIIILTNLSETAISSHYKAKVDFMIKANVPFLEVVEKAKKILAT